MPYIKQDRREKLRNFPIITTPGEMNFLITEMLQRYIKLRGESYQTYNDLIGALECCKLELYRRKIAPYEDEKIKTNGDVY